jgi:hypothetical protein
MVDFERWPSVRTNRLSSTLRTRLHCTTLSFDRPPSPLETGTSTGYRLGTFSAPVMIAMIETGEYRFPISFWMTTQGLVLFGSLPMAGSRFTSKTMPRVHVPGIRLRRNRHMRTLHKPDVLVTHLPYNLPPTPVPAWLFAGIPDIALRLSGSVHCDSFPIQQRHARRAPRGVLENPQRLSLRW